MIISNRSLLQTKISNCMMESCLSAATRPGSRISISIEETSSTTDTVTASCDPFECNVSVSTSSLLSMAVLVIDTTPAANIASRYVKPAQNPTIATDVKVKPSSTMVTMR